jgi:hypothetical protein
MKKRDYVLVFSGLKAGTHELEYSLDAAFFAQYDHPDTEGLVKAEVQVVLVKGSLTMEFRFAFNGLLATEDDDTAEPFELPLHNAFTVVVRFGEAYDDQNPELLILPHGSYEVDLSQYLYELAVLSIPLRKSKNEIND